MPGNQRQKQYNIILQKFTSTQRPPEKRKDKSPIEPPTKSSIERANKPSIESSKNRKKKKRNYSSSSSSDSSTLSSSTSSSTSDSINDSGSSIELTTKLKAKFAEMKKKKRDHKKRNRIGNRNQPSFDKFESDPNYEQIVYSSQKTVSTQQANTNQMCYYNQSRLLQIYIFNCSFQISGADLMCLNDHCNQLYQNSYKID